MDTTPNPDSTPPERIVGVPTLRDDVVVELPQVEVPIVKAGVTAFVRRPRRLGDRETMRGTLALTLLGLYGALIAAVLFFVYRGKSELKDVITLIAPLPVLLGTAIGFYFGHEAASGRTSSDKGGPAE